MDVGFIGLGAMGSRMAANLVGNGHRVTAWNRSPVDLPEGAEPAADAATVGRAAPQAFVVVTGPNDVRDVVLGSGGWAEGAAPGSLLIQCSTIGPTAARNLDLRLRELGLRSIDAPVGGSTDPAAVGQLVVMAGGDPGDIAQAAPLLDAIGSKTIRFGDIGAGSAVKLLVNAVLLGALAAEAEVVAWLTQAEPELDLQLVAGALERISPAAAGRLADLAAEPGPPGFSVRHAEKDIRLVLEEAGAGIVLGAVADALASAATAGFGDEDFAALGANARALRG